MNEPIANQKYRLSIKGVFAYMALWAIVFAVVRILADYSSLGATGTYSVEAAMLTDFLLPVAIGLVFVAIGIAIAFLFGAKKHAAAVVLWCFIVGVLLLPMLWVAIVILSGLGIISLD